MKSTALKTQRNFCVNHKTVSGLFQEARLENVRFVRVQPLEREIRNAAVWGVLVTARLGDEVHSAWVVTGFMRLPALVQTGFAEVTQQVAQLIKTLAIQAGFEVRQGLYYAPEVMLYQYAAALPVAELQEGER